MASPTALEILSNALKRRDELRLESEALDSLIETYKKLFGTDDPAKVPHEEQPDLYRGSSTRALHAARVVETLDAARRIIIAEKRPMKRGELVKRLLAQNYEIVGRDKNKVFGTNLWRSGRFITVEGKGYWPNDVELPR
jgi:hypothetical protein